MVRDASEKSDIKKSYSQFKAPNFHQAAKGFPVYGAGQPTEKGLIYLIDHLVDEGHTVSTINVQESNKMYSFSTSDDILDHLNQRLTWAFLIKLCLAFAVVSSLLLTVIFSLLKRSQGKLMLYLQQLHLDLVKVFGGGPVSKLLLALSSQTCISTNLDLLMDLKG